MIIHVLRALFILLMVAVGWSYRQGTSEYTWLTMIFTLTLGVFIVCIDILSPRRKLAVFSGTFLGLIVGLFIAYALSFVVQLLVMEYVPAISHAAADRLMIKLPDGSNTTYGEVIVRFVNLVVGIISCYFAISFILQTKDDFRFIIPYVEFSRQTKGARPILLDTSVLIDGRINDIAATGILDSQLVVPRFVLRELQTVADSADKLKRVRGRRGLDMLAKLQNNNHVEVILYETADRRESEAGNVDEKLLVLASQLNARVLTNDLNLNKVAQLRGVDVININDLSGALRPVVLPGERMRVRLVKAGEEPGQGIGFTEEGTMVVVEQGRPHLNEDVELTVTSVLQTSAGRMIFGKLSDLAASSARRIRPNLDSSTTA